MSTAELGESRGQSVRGAGADGATSFRSPRVPDRAGGTLAVPVAVRWAAGAATLVLVLCYTVTSLVVVLNATGNATGVIWLPSFPDWYYASAAGLYRPFAGWFALIEPVRGHPAVDYTTYAWVSRAPFLAFLPAALAAWGARPGRRLLVAGATFGTLILVVATGALGAHALGNLGVRGAVEAAAREAGAWGPAILFVLMVAQAVPTPVPTVAITLAAGLLYGTAWGSLLAWSGAMVAAAVSFALGRWLGRPIVSRLGGARALDAVDRWSGSGSFRAVLVARLIPPVSYRATSLAAGLLPIGLPSFLIATGVGQAPATVAYAALGASLLGDASTIAWAAGAIGIAVAVVSLVEAWTRATAQVRASVVRRGLAVVRTVRFRLGASLALMGLLAWQLGTGQVGDALRSADPGWLAVGAAGTVAALAVSALKWQVLLRAAGVRAGYGLLFEAYVVGLFFNNFLPSNVGGDVARARIVGKSTGSSAIVAGSIIGERLLAGLALVATAVGALAVSPWLAGIVGDAVGAIGLAFVALTLGCAVPGPRARVVAWLGPDGKRGAVARAVIGLGASLGRPSVVATVFAWSLVFQALVIVVAWSGFRAVGADVPVDAVIALIPVISAVQLLPVSVGGLGVREGAYAVLFGACCGTPAAESVAASLAFAGIVAAVSIVGGVRFATRGASARPGFEGRQDPDTVAIATVVREIERTTWFDAGWLWNFVDGMRTAGRTPEQTLAALRRQGSANRLAGPRLITRRLQLLARAVGRVFVPPASPEA